MRALLCINGWTRLQPTQAGITQPRCFTQSPCCCQPRLWMGSVAAAMLAPGPHLCCIVEHFHAVHLRHHKNNRLAIRLTAATACCCWCRLRRQGRQRTPHTVAAERLAHACCYAGAAVGCVAGRHGQFEAHMVLLLPRVLCTADRQSRVARRRDEEKECAARV